MREKVFSKNIRIAAEKVALVEYFLETQYNREFEKELYGVSIETRDGEERATARDMFIYRENAMEFISILHKNNVTAVSLRDIAEDFIYG